MSQPSQFQNIDENEQVQSLAFDLYAAQRKSVYVNHPILLVEDNPDDVLITQRAWKKGLIKNRLYVVNDGEQALEFIYKKGEYVNAPTPSLMLLDLKMPKVDGFEVLKTVKQDDALKSMPIVVLTSSRDNVDLDRAYGLGCNSFIVKPVGYANFLEAVIDIQKYWILICEIPNR